MSNANRGSAVPASSPVVAAPPAPVPDAGKEARTSSAVRNYMLFGFAGLLLMVPVLLMKGMDLWCVFPLIVGALSLMAHWRAGPIYVLISLALVIWLRARGIDPATCMAMGFTGLPSGLILVTPTPMLDFLLSVCVLAYLASHYRLQALVYHVVPPEPYAPVRRSPLNRPSPEPPMNPRRTPGSLTFWELPLLGVAALLSGLVSEFAWTFFHGLRPKFDLPDYVWQTLTFIWASGMILLLAWTLFSYLARKRMNVAQSLLYLQDQLWRQTRREQSRISYWIAWARLHYQAWKEDGE